MLFLGVQSVCTVMSLLVGVVLPNDYGLYLAWQRPSSPIQLVNEVEDPGGMVWLEERLSVCERFLDLLHPHRKWVVWLWWGVVECH